MKKYLILTLSFLIFQADAFTPARVVTPLQRLSKFYPEVVRILEGLRNKYSSEEAFEDMVNDIVDGKLSAHTIEKFYHNHNNDLNILYNAIEHGRREGPRVFKGKQLLEEKHDIIRQIYSIAGNNESLTHVFHALRTFYSDDKSYSDMLSFIIAYEISRNTLWGLYLKSGSDSKKMYYRLTNLQWAKAV